jgi:hypothetical protein
LSFVTVRLLKRRSALRDADFHFLALAFRGARVLHPFSLTAWVFLPDAAAAGHTICPPAYPLVCVVMKSIPLCGTSSTILVNRRREASGEPWRGNSGNQES